MSGKKGATWKNIASKKRMSKIMMGNKHQEKKRSKATRMKIARALKGNKHTFGYKHSNEFKIKCRLTKVGKKNPAWKGGVSFEPYSMEWKKEIKNLIKKRDNCTCQICQKSFSLEDKELHVHHIDYNKKNCLPENLISLCHSCHSKTNFKRKFWQKYLQEAVNEQFQKVYVSIK